jgi:hypothetical protein
MRYAAAMRYGHLDIPKRAAWILVGGALFVSGGPGWSVPAACAGAAALGVGAIEPEAARREIEEVARQMCAKVLAADIDGYLSHVDMSDAVFAQEHRMWAKDLGRNTPLKFEMAIAAEGFELREKDGAMAAEADVAFTWAMPIVKNEAHLKPTAEQLKTPGKDRTLTLRCRFTRASGSSPWLFAGEIWNAIDGPNVRACYETEDLRGTAQIVIDVLPEVRAHVEAGFGLAESELPRQLQEVKLYTSMEHLQFSIYPSYDDPLGGWNEPGESIKILASEAPRKNQMRVLLAHEYGHVATFFLGPKSSDMPWWVLEGVAELSAERFAGGGRSTEGMVRTWAERNQLLRWEQLADFRGEAQEHQGHVYTQGHHMIGYLSDRFGREKRTAWLRLLAHGATLEDATTEALGVTWASIDADWRASLTKPAAAEGK